MKSHKAKAFLKKKAFNSKYKVRDLESSDSGSDVDESTLYRNEIDDFHNNNNEKLSIGNTSLHHDKYEILEQEEVLPITDDEMENNNEYSDSENDNYEDDLPNLDAWGKDKRTYYSADFIDRDKGITYRKDDEDRAKAEEKGALEMQKSLASIMTTENFHTIFSKFDSPDEYSDEEQKEVTIDWSAATDIEKLKLLKKTSPEFLILINEFKEKLTEVKDRILPLLEFAKQGKIASDKCENYLNLKYQLLMHYCMNISFYMVLKSQGTMVTNHPVLERIFTYKKLLNQLQPTDDKLKPEIDIFFEKIKNSEEIELATEDQSEEEEEDTSDQDLVENAPAVKTPEAGRSVEKKVKKVHFETETEKEIFAMYSDMKERQKKKKEKEKAGETQEVIKDNEKMDVDPKDAESEEKRIVTKEISKNRGKTPNRKKEMRNPRIRLKNKYNRALKKRRSQVKNVVREVNRYDGESTGISSHVVRSTKFK